MNKYYVEMIGGAVGNFAIEIYAHTQAEAIRMAMAQNPNTRCKRITNLTQERLEQEKQQRDRQTIEAAHRRLEQRDRQNKEEEERRHNQKNREQSASSSEYGTDIFGIIGFLIKLALFAIAALIVLKIALYLMIVWESLLYISIIVGFMVLIVKLKNNARKVSMVFAVIAIPFMIFRMTQLVDDYKEHFANEEKLQLERAEQKAKESKKTPTHEKAVSKEQKSVKNTGSN